MVKVKVGETDIEFDSTIGVKQGDTLAPVLFLFVIQAAAETLEPIWPAGPLEFSWKEKGRVSGANWRTMGSVFKFISSFYADDGAFLFNTRAELEACVPILHAHLQRLGLLMHVGTADKASKTECMYYPPHRNDDISAEDTAPVKADETGGCVSFTDSFKYLGSRIDCDLQDVHDVCSRIKSAAGAFGALRKQLFESRHFSFQTKKVVYVTLVVNILLYGAECWCLTEDLLARLRSFHHRCLRAMCGVTRWHTWRHRIRTSELRRRLRLETIDVYIGQRKIRWAGHVARMGAERFPRKFLTAWVRHPRPHGRPQYTYGHSLNKTLERAGITTNFKEWRAMAQDRGAWRARIDGMAEYPTPPPVRGTPQ